MNPRQHILVVEDKHNERLAIARLLEQEEYAVKLAESPEQAIGFLDEQIDLVISDLRMGENSGRRSVAAVEEPPAGDAVHHRDCPRRCDVGGRSDEARRRRLPDQARQPR